MRSEATSSFRAVTGEKRRAAKGRVSRVPFSLPSFFWASKRKKGAAAHPPLSKSIHREAIRIKKAVTPVTQSKT
jgi:hypothetical protein